MTVQGAPTLPPLKRVAFVGEFSVGKTTLINAMLPETFRLPTGPLPLSTIPLVVRYGTTPALEGVADRKLTRLNPRELADLVKSDPPAFDALRLSVPSEALRTMVLCDIHGLKGPESVARASALISRCSEVAWLTLGTQAWKRSESAIWRSLSTHLEGARRSLLVTHADLITPKERVRVHQRLAELTPRLFDAVHFIGRSGPSTGADDVSGAPQVVSADDIASVFGATSHRKRRDTTRTETVVPANSPPPLPDKVASPVAADSASAAPKESSNSASVGPSPAAAASKETVPAPSVAASSATTPQSPSSSASAVAGAPTPAPETRRPSAPSRPRITTVRRPITATSAANTPLVSSPTKGNDMANNAQTVLDGLKNDVAGFIAAALADSDSGMALARVDGGMGFDVDVAAAANTEVVKAKLRAMKALKVQGGIEDILITLQDQYHLIRPLKETPTVFLYLAVNRSQANLAMARHSLKNTEAELKL